VWANARYSSAYRSTALWNSDCLLPNAAYRLGRDQSGKLYVVGTDLPGGPEVGTARWDFFVSYTAADLAWAEWIAWQLESAGYRVLFQAWDFVPGSHWTTRMRAGIAGSERTLAVLSQSYLQSVFGQAEWQAAYRSDPQGFSRKLVPVRVEDCERPDLLGEVVSFDLFGYPEDAARRWLLDRINVVLAGRAKPPTAPAFPGPAPPATVLHPDSPPPRPPQQAPPPTAPAFPGTGPPTARPADSPTLGNPSPAADTSRGESPLDVRRYLLPSEHPVIEVRRHWAWLAARALPSCGLLLVGLVAMRAAWAPGWLDALILYFTVFVVLRSVWITLDWWTERFIVTDRRILLVTGIAYRNVAIIPLAKVTALTYNRSAAGVLLGYGEFVIESTGQDEALSRISYLPKTEKLYIQISELLYDSKK